MSERERGVGGVEGACAIVRAMVQRDAPLSTSNSSAWIGTRVYLCNMLIYTTRTRGHARAAWRQDAREGRMQMRNPARVANISTRSKIRVLICECNKLVELKNEVFTSPHATHKQKNER